VGAKSDVCLREKKIYYNRFKIKVLVKIFWSNKDEKKQVGLVQFTPRDFSITNVAKLICCVTIYEVTTKQRQNMHAKF
jgi:hypothetical protein